MIIYELYACDEWRSNIGINSRIMATTDMDQLSSYIYENYDKYIDEKEIDEGYLVDEDTFLQAIINQKIDYLHYEAVESGEITN